MNSTEIQFTPERMKQFEKTLSHYERKASALLPALYLAQDQFGFLSPPVLEYVARLLEIPASVAFEAASFYVLFKRKDMGRWWIQVCNNITCMMMGSRELLNVLREELGVSLGELSEDKLFSTSCVQCLGSCDTAPVVQINDEYVENLTPQKFRALLRCLKSGDTQVST